MPKSEILRKLTSSTKFIEHSIGHSLTLQPRLNSTDHEVVKLINTKLSVLNSNLGVYPPKFLNLNFTIFKIVVISI